MQREQPSPPKNVLADLIIPLLALAFVAYYLTTITEVPWISQASAVFVSGLLILAIGAFAVRTVSRVKRGVETITTNFPAVDASTQTKRTVLLGLTIAYILALDTLGFTLTTTVFLFAAIVLLSSASNWKAAALTAVTCSVAGYVIFIYLFKTRFPSGWIENTLEVLLRGA